MKKERTPTLNKSYFERKINPDNENVIKLIKLI